MISIITACYNGLTGIGADAIKRCLDSVSRIPCPHEHLIMDGNSSDGSVEFIRGLHMPGVSLHSEKDAGVYDALNKGITKATGDYVYVLGLDDYIEHPEILAKVYGITAAEECDIAVSPVKDSKDRLVPTDESLLLQLYYRMPVSHQGVLERRSLLEESGGYDVSYQIIADYKHLLEAVFKGRKIKYIPDQYTRFALGGLSSQQSAIDKEMARLHRNFYPMAEEDMAKVGILSIPNIFQLLTARDNLMLRKMGALALRERMWKKWKTGTHKYFAVAGIVFKIRRHFFKMANSNNAGAVYGN